MKHCLFVYLLLIILFTSAYSAIETINLIPYCYDTSSSSSLIDITKDTSILVIDNTYIKLPIKKDCGVWALGYMLNHLSITFDTTTSCLIEFDSQQGVSMFSLVQAANNLEYDAKGYRLPYSELLKQPKPLIVYIPNHFTVLTNIDTTAHLLHFADITNPDMQITESAFQRIWKGYILEIKRK